MPTSLGGHAQICPSTTTAKANMANAYAATIKLPDFWQHNPWAWFQHIEAQFLLRGITQDVTKYFHVVASLDTATTARTMQLLEAPPATGKYTALKAFLLQLYELSGFRKHHKNHDRLVNTMKVTILNGLN